MNHIGLFEGIGGFSLAARWMGWETIAWCEWNEFGQKVLKHHFPKAQPHGDITKTDFTIYRGQCDIVTGGFPCQPYSLAGKRKGKADDRHLWPEMCRAIREIQPTWVVGENVFGLVSWNGGLVFNEVQADLEAEGYEVFPYVLPAVSVNAPHRRDRIFFVAYNSNGRIEKMHQRSKYKNKTESTTNPDNARNATHGCRTDRNGEKESSQREQPQFESNRLCNTRDAPNPNSNGQHGSNSEYEINTSERGFNAQRDVEQMGSNDVADTNSRGLERSAKVRRDSEYAIGEDGNTTQIGDVADTDSRRQPIKKHGQTESRRIAETSIPSDWQNFPTQSPICSGDDGLSTRLDSITFPKWRNESIKAAGNAIVPQVAFQIFKSIQLYNEKL
jgi:DNA (cytosine-5)-methyltransferase 1